MAATPLIGEPLTMKAKAGPEPMPMRGCPTSSLRNFASRRRGLSISSRCCGRCPCGCDIERRERKRSAQTLPRRRFRRRAPARPADPNRKCDCQAGPMCASRLFLPTLSISAWVESLGVKLAHYPLGGKYLHSTNERWQDRKRLRIEVALFVNIGISSS